MQIGMAVIRKWTPLAMHGERGGFLANMINTRGFYLIQALVAGGVYPLTGFYLLAVRVLLLDVLLGCPVEAKDVLVPAEIGLCD